MFLWWKVVRFYKVNSQWVGELSLVLMMSHPTELRFRLVQFHLIEKNHRVKREREKDSSKRLIRKKRDFNEEKIRKLNLEHLDDS